jgi:hypothetical protein
MPFASPVRKQLLIIKSRPTFKVIGGGLKLVRSDRFEKMSAHSEPFFARQVDDAAIA